MDVINDARKWWQANRRAVLLGLSPERDLSLQIVELAFAAGYELSKTSTYTLTNDLYREELAELDAAERLEAEEGQP